MAAQNTETLLFVVDINSNSARITELAAETRKAKEEFAKLQAAVKAGTADASLLDTASVKLKTTLAQNGQETRALTKANETQLKATQANAGSIEQLRAQLALGTAEYNKLSSAERDNTEAGQKLQTNNKMLSDNLKVLEAAIGDTRRNVGNYAGSIEPLIQQLVKLQEQQKHIAPDSAAYTQAQAKVIGFQQAVNDAGVKAGLSYDQTQAKLKNYGDAIQPATAKLVKLEEEQKKVGEGSVEYTKIGFQIGKAAKEIEKVPAETKKASQSLKEAALNSGLFGDSIDKATKFTGQFKSGLDVLKGGFKGVKEGEDAATEGTKVLKIGFAEIGIGLLILAFTTLVSYFTQSAEGAKILKGFTSALGATFQVLTDIVSGTGRAIALIFTGDFKGAAKQIQDQFTGIGSKIATAAKEGYNLVGAEKELIKQRRLLEIEDVKEQSRVNVLLRLTKDRSKSSAEQLAALKEAGEIEARLTTAQIAQQEKELALIQQKISLKGKGAAGDLLQEKAEKEKQIAETLAAQDETNAKIQTRESVFREKLAADAKEAAKKARDAAQKATQDAIRDRITATETELLSVKEGSDRELQLRTRLIGEKAELEAAGEKKRAAERRQILAESLAETLKLDEDFDKKRQENARKFLDDQLSRDQTALAAEKKRRDDAAKEVSDSFKQNERLLDNHLARVRAETEESYADGKLSKKQYDAQVEIQEENALGARLILAKQFGKDTSAIEESIAKLKGKYLRTQTDAENAEYRERLVHAQQFGQEVGQLFADTLTDTGQSLQEFSGKVLVLVLNELETYILAQQAKAFARAVATEGPLGILEAGIESAAITVAFEAAKALITQSTASAKPFATGGIVPGVGNTDSVPAILTPGEIVMNKAASTEHAPVLSYLNSISGGANFAPGFTPRSISQPNDGGLVSRTIGQSYPSAAEIGAAVGRNVPTSIAVDEINRANGRKARARALTRLG